MKKFVLFVFIMLVSSMLVWALGCAKPAPAPSPTPAPPPKPTATPTPAWPKTLTIATAAPGTSVAIYAIGLAKIVERYVGIPTSPATTSAILEATMLFLKGDTKMTMTNTANGGYAIRNKDPFPGGSGRMRGIIFGEYESMFHWIVRADSDINTFSDLKGKRIMVKREGEIVVEDMWRAVLKAYGMTETDAIILPSLAAPDMCLALSEKRTDAFVQPTAPPGPAFLELSRTTPIRVLSLSDSAVKYLKDNISWEVGLYVMPPGVYKGQDKEVVMAKFGMGLMAQKDLPNDLTYAIAKAIDEHVQELREVHASFKNWTMKGLANNPFVPYHAGAYKYYMEKGLLTPESIAKHKSLLSLVGQES